MCRNSVLYRAAAASAVKVRERRERGVCITFARHDLRSVPLREGAHLRRGMT